MAKEIKQKLVSGLGDQILDVIIFGSRIRSRNRPDSDYDVLIILKGQNNRMNRRLISDLC